MYRIEHDSMGEVSVPEDRYWGPQTQRSLENFVIGEEKMPFEVIHAIALVKKAAAEANAVLLPQKMTEKKLKLISNACDRIISGELDSHFPLAVWQTGSGTQTNMNVNEVIANVGNEAEGERLLHPNDDVNMSQSSNDVFPSAMHVAAVCEIKKRLLPALTKLSAAFAELEEDNREAVKCGRTHLQDATPIKFSQEVSGWRAMLEHSGTQIEKSLEFLSEIAIGGTAVGTGINAPEGFGPLAAEKLSRFAEHKFVSEENKFHALSSKDALVFAHGALKSLAADLMKIANDVRWLASGPRCGLGEITLQANEPGSSIMPGKVNPTQCEAVTMVAVQVMGNDVTVGIAASQGNFELNVYMPVLIYNFLQSVRLLSDVMNSFCDKCVCKITVNKERMKENLLRSLMLVTSLNPYIGYENSARVAKLAYEENITLRQACIRLGYLSEEEFDRVFHPEII